MDNLIFMIRNNYLPLDKLKMQQAKDVCNYLGLKVSGSKTVKANYVQAIANYLNK